MPERILFIHNGKMTGYGLDLVTAQQVQALSEAGYHVDLLSRGHLDLPNVRSLTNRYTRANLISWVGRSIYNDAKKRAMGALALAQLRREDYTAVIGWVSGMLPLVRETQRRGVPLFLNVPRLFGVGQPEGEYPECEQLRPWHWPRISQSEKRSEYRDTRTELLLPSMHCHKVLVEAGVPGRRLHVIERGFNSQKFYPPDEVTDTFRLLFCGKLGLRKGIMPALLAWREAALKDAEFWFAGNTPPQYEDKWRQAACENVRFLGFRKDMGDVMRQCHAQILLSDDEGQAKSLIEGGGDFAALER